MQCAIESFWLVVWYGNYAHRLAGGHLGGAVVVVVVPSTAVVSMWEAREAGVGAGWMELRELQRRLHLSSFSVDVGLGSL